MDWPHAPVHRLTDVGAYMVTGGTLHKQHLFQSPERLDLLQDALLSLAREFGWVLQAWAIFSNHYHFVALSPENPGTLRPFLSKVHSTSAHALNRLDKAAGRKVWYQFWDTHVTFQRSYLARLHYVHTNAVHHGLVRVPSTYHWCSASWFERSASPAFQKTLANFKIDHLQVFDDF